MSMYVYIGCVCVWWWRVFSFRSEQWWWSDVILIRGSELKQFHSDNQHKWKFMPDSIPAYSCKHGSGDEQSSSSWLFIHYLHGKVNRQGRNRTGHTAHCKSSAIGCTVSLDWLRFPPIRCSKGGSTLLPWQRLKPSRQWCTSLLLQRFVIIEFYHITNVHISLYTTIQKFWVSTCFF